MSRKKISLIRCQCTCLETLHIAAIVALSCMADAGVGGLCLAGWLVDKLCSARWLVLFMSMKYRCVHCCGLEEVGKFSC